MFSTIRFRLKKRKLSKNTKINYHSETKETNVYNDWLENSIANKSIKCYEHSKFQNFQQIGGGSYARVVRVNLEEKTYALKYFNSDQTTQATLEKLVKELKLHMKIGFNENVLQFFGITKVDMKETVSQISKYCLVLEYADSGTLNTYLKEHFNELDWNDKYQLAYQLANAVSYLHEKNIIHRDLHANNILVHNKTIKLADFGLSKDISNGYESNNALNIFGIIPYIDPNHLNDNYKLSKESDVYSVGVLFWQISSGRQPFDGINYDIKLSLDIINGKREQIIEDTPVNYSNLYTDCWKGEPNDRPVIQEVVLTLEKLIKTKDYQKELHNVNKIDSKNLTYPLRGKSDDMRGKDLNCVIKRIYNGQEVACKKITEENKQSLKILMQLSECSVHILRFYGISKIEGDNVMVLEWAERGTLRQLYEKKYIKWNLKIRIALGICRGLIFLQTSDILHHDLRCDNILMTESLEPRICNFKLAWQNGVNTTIPTNDRLKDIIPWLAPEQLADFKSKYTIQCEIFSFAMLLWELASEKIPYQGWGIEKIKNHVITGGRENFKFNDYHEYIKIINNAWKQNPQERCPFLQLLEMLEDLYSLVNEDLLPDKISDLNNDLELPDSEQSIPLEEGIQAFKNKEHQKAWECFDFHAQNNDITAKYWKGRYLWEGYLDGIKKREEGKELLKEAADKGNPDAQLRYAFTLSNDLNKNNNRQIFMEYLNKAAIEGNNSAAQYNLGDIYLKGKNNIPKDKTEGIKWLKKAASQDHPKAIKLLNELSNCLLY